MVIKQKNKEGFGRVVLSDVINAICRIDEPEVDEPEVTDKELFEALPFFTKKDFMLKIDPLEFFHNDEHLKYKEKLFRNYQKIRKKKGLKYKGGYDD